MIKLTSTLVIVAGLFLSACTDQSGLVTQNESSQSNPVERTEAEALKDLSALHPWELLLRVGPNDSTAAVRSICTLNLVDGDEVCGLSEDDLIYAQGAGDGGAYNWVAHIGERASDAAASIPGWLEHDQPYLLKSGSFAPDAQSEFAMIVEQGSGDAYLRYHTNASSWSIINAGPGYTFGQSTLGAAGIRVSDAYFCDYQSGPGPDGLCINAGGIHTIRWYSGWSIGGQYVYDNSAGTYHPSSEFYLDYVDTNGSVAIVDDDFQGGAGGYSYEWKVPESLSGSMVSVEGYTFEGHLDTSQQYYVVPGSGQ